MVDHTVVIIIIVRFRPRRLIIAIVGASRTEVAALPRVCDLG